MRDKKNILKMRKQSLIETYHANIKFFGLSSYIHFAVQYDASHISLYFLAEK